MKKTIIKVLPVFAFAILLQGCIAIPPLIQVESKGNNNNAEVLRRLDQIDKRLDRLETKVEKQ